MFPLAMAQQGEKWVIQKIMSEHEIKTRFMELGFCEGVQITIMASEQGNVIIKNKDSTFAIDKDFAKHIFVN